MGLVCPPTYNLAEFLVRQLAQQEDAESQIRLFKICNEFKMSEHYERLLKKLDNEMSYSKQKTVTTAPGDLSKSFDSICEV